MKSGKTIWRSPSNIAIVKYWGKKGFQQPANPSISMSLSKCYTETSIEYTPKTGADETDNFKFDGLKNAGFEDKVFRFIETARREMPGIGDLTLKIESSNSFPHSAGIASSASAMSSLALCLCHIDQQVTGINEDEEQLYRKASRLARMGSGSACRSVYGGWVLWGKTEESDDSSDDYSTTLKNILNEKFSFLYDSILIVDSGIKQVTSSAGHSRMETNRYREIKYESGRLNASLLIKSLTAGDWKSFRIIAENEASGLHAMFLLNDPPYYLIKPESLVIIEKLKKFREESGLDLCFTLDAGPNIHLLYPSEIRETMKSFIISELLQFCEGGKWIDDFTGKGPELIL